MDPALASTGQAYTYAGDNPANASDPSGLCTGYVNGQEYQLEGIEGAGACDHYIEGRLEGQGSAVAGPLEAHQSAFSTALDAELGKAAQSLAAGQDFTDAVILDPGQCPSVAACTSDRRTALGDVEQLQRQLAYPDEVVNGAFAGGVRGTDLCLGAQQVADPVAPPKGGARDVIGIILFGGTVIVLVVVIKFLGPHLRLKPPVGVPSPVPPVPTPDPNSDNLLRVQLQAKHLSNNKTYATIAEIVGNNNPPGVTKDQGRNALNDVYTRLVNGGPLKPREVMPPNSGPALAVWTRLVASGQRAIDAAVGPIACSGRGINTLQQVEVYKKDEFRIDFDCLRGYIFAQ